MKQLILGIMGAALLFSPADDVYYMLVGTYNSEKSEGIYVYRFNSSDASVEEVSHVNASNASYLAVAPGGKYVYATNENGKDDNGGEVSAYSFDKKSGRLTFLNKQLSGGDHPCYVEIDRTGKWVIVGNYSSGTLSVLPVNTDGSLGTAIQTIHHQGAGVNKKRQDKPHVHCTILSKDNKWLFVPDLGIDKVMIYAFDEKKGKLSPSNQQFAETVGGSGPRHFIIHPTNRQAYLVEEMTGTISVYDYQDGKLESRQRISMLPGEFKGAIGAADIHISPDGHFLYASNRGDANDISIFSVNQVNGQLTLLGNQSTLGKSPRNFSLDPSAKYLLAANQSSNEIVIFYRDEKSGLLTDTKKRIEVGKPVCIKWIP